MPRPPTPVPVSTALSTLHRRIAAWRLNRRKPGRMPEALWVAAVNQARNLGVNPVARALRLDYYSLKKRLDAAAADPAPRFVEVSIPAGGWTPPVTTTLEIERADGSRLRVQAGGADNLIRELAMAFLERP